MIGNIDELKLSITRKGELSDYIALSQAYGNELRYENAARTLLCIQKQEYATPGGVNATDSGSGLQIIIPCGGNASRWDNFLSRPKHLVLLDRYTLLLERTRRQISAHLCGENVRLLLDKKSSHMYPSLHNTGVIFKDNSRDNNVGLEVLIHPDLDKTSNLLWIYGDTYFSENAFNIIANDLSRDLSNIRFYGRKSQNSEYGNNGGEIFAVYVPLNLLEDLKQIYLFVKRLYIGTPMYRFSSWEVVACLSALYRETDIHEWRRYAKDKGATQVLADMCAIWKERLFSDKLWVEINDETEDFDYPCEYLNWLFRRAHAQAL